MRLFAQHICCCLLGIDPKTLRRWTALAQIAFLPSPLDARLRCLTWAHLVYLASIHDRPLAPLPDTLTEEPPEEPPAMHPPQATIDPPPALAQIQQCVETLQQQLSQLALDLLHERTRREEQEQAVRQILLASQPRASKETHLPPSPPQEQASPASSSRKGRPRALVPLIAAQPDGTYLVISPEYGEVSIVPESRQWFAWLDSLTSFRFVGQHGRLSTNRKRGRNAWMAYRRLHGHVTHFSLGPTSQLTIAHLEHMAALLQTPASRS
jgi:hypothetical protein